MSPMVLRKTILAELAAYDPYQVAQPTLIMAVREKIPALDIVDVTEALSWLRDHTMIDFIGDRLDPDNREARKWFITNGGRAALKS